MEHLPLDYRAPGESKYGPPADVCDGCSDFERGLLVPVSFCDVAMERMAELDRWYLSGDENPPSWIAVARDRYEGLFL